MGHPIVLPLSPEQEEHVDFLFTLTRALYVTAASFCFFQLNGIITKDIYNSAFTIILQLREICLGRPNLGAIAFKFVVVSAFGSVSPKYLF